MVQGIQERLDPELVEGALSVNANIIAQTKAPITTRRNFTKKASQSFLLNWSLPFQIYSSVVSRKIEKNKELKTLRTYTSDMADAVRENEASVIKIALAEKEKRERDAAEEKIK